MFVDEVLPGTGVSTAVYAPNATLAYSHPKLTGLSNLVGLKLLSLEFRRPQLIKAIEAYPGLRASVSGSLRLVNKDIAIVIELPVFLASAPEYLDGSVYDDDSRCATPAARERNCRFEGPPDEATGAPTYFWGFVFSTCLKVDLLAQLHLEDLDAGGAVASSVGGALRWQLINNSPHSTLNGTNGVFAASRNASADTPMAGAVLVPISLGGLSVNWTIAMAPEAGWPTTLVDFAGQLVLIFVFTLVGGVGIGAVAIASLRAQHTRTAHDSAASAAAQLEAERNEAAMLARSRLIRSVMHDLRSPLLSVHALAAELSLKPAATRLDAVRSELDAVGQCTALMEHIVSDMLGACVRRGGGGGGRRWRRVCSARVRRRGGAGEWCGRVAVRLWLCPRVCVRGRGRVLAGCLAVCGSALGLMPPRMQSTRSLSRPCFACLHRNSLTHSLSFSLSLTLPHSLSLTLPCSLSLTLPHSLTRSLPRLAFPLPPVATLPPTSPPAPTRAAPAQTLSGSRQAVSASSTRRSARTTSCAARPPSFKRPSTHAGSPSSRRRRAARRRRPRPRRRARGARRLRARRGALRAGRPAAPWRRAAAAAVFK
jgi:hypothetical protein